MKRVIYFTIFVKKSVSVLLYVMKSLKDGSMGHFQFVNHLHTGLLLLKHMHLGKSGSHLTDCDELLFLNI
jgi:hypothetical protein